MQPKRLLCVPGLFALACSACVTLPLRSEVEPPRVLYPQASQAAGQVSLKPRHAREGRPLLAPALLESGDWIETGADGKVEILLPQAALRLYAHTRIQVLYTFDDRTIVAKELRLDAGEVLVRPLGGELFVVRAPGLHVEAPPGSVLIVGSRGQVHRAACYAGRAEARNPRVRGQTVIRVGAGQRVTVDDAADLAVLEEVQLPDEWPRWEEADAAVSGLVPPPAGPRADSEE